MVQDLQVRAAAACKAHDLRAARAVVRDSIRDIDSKTCKLGAYLDENEFTQRDQDTWISTGTRGLCNVSHVARIWRAKQEPTQWSYSYLESPAPNADPTCVATASSASYAPGERLAQLPCTFVSL